MKIDQSNLSISRSSLDPKICNKYFLISLGKLDHIVILLRHATAQVALIELGLLFEMDAFGLGSEGQLYAPTDVLHIESYDETELESSFQYSETKTKVKLPVQKEITNEKLGQFFKSLASLMIGKQMNEIM